MRPINVEQEINVTGFKEGVGILTGISPLLLINSSEWSYITETLHW